MNLRKIKIENFKGIFTPIIFDVSEFNVIVGQNDAGKSTILKALNIFLNDKNPIKEDLNNKAENNLIKISLFFDPNKTKIILDETITTTYEDEELINEDIQVEIVKSWDVDKSKITPEVFIKYKTYFENNFIDLSEKELIKLCEKLKIDTKKANSEEYNNVEKRKKIRQYYVDNSIAYNYEYIKLPTTGKSRMKAVLDSLKDNLPSFEYFHADTSLTESDTSIQNYFKKLTEKTILEQVDKNDLEDKVKTELNKVLDRITNKINQVVSTDEMVIPEISFDWGKLVTTTFKSKDDIKSVPLSSRGDGFRRITMMAYFETLSEEDSSGSNNIIYGFEEPETFLHPSGQENLFDKLSSLSNNYQVFVTTHSPIIVANTERKYLSHVYKDENNKYNVQQNINNLKEIADDLGITIDNQFIHLFDKAKLLLLVEGIDDTLVLNHIAKSYKDNNLIKKDFQELDVALIPIGGCDSIKHWVSLDLIKTFNKKTFIIQDSDKVSEVEKSATKESLIKLGFKEDLDFAITKKRAMENYIPCGALRRLIPGISINYGDWDKVKDICAKNKDAVKLGGKKVLEKHFKNLTFSEIRSTFYDGKTDEFLKIYNQILNLLK